MRYGFKCIAILALLYSKVLCANAPTVFCYQEIFACVMRLARNIFISGLCETCFGFGRDRAYDVIAFSMFLIRINNRNKYKNYLWNTKIDNTSNIFARRQLAKFCGDITKNIKLRVNIYLY
jgi:hypothetical protein